MDTPIRIAGLDEFKDSAKHQKIVKWLRAVRHFAPLHWACFRRDLPSVLWEARGPDQRGGLHRDARARTDEGTRTEHRRRG